MKRLNAQLFSEPKRPIRAVQFGGGSFLRSFVDDMVDQSNKKGISDIGIAIVHPTPVAVREDFTAQDNLYSVAFCEVVQGKKQISHRVVHAIQAVIDPYTAFEDFLQLATLDTLEFIFSNTTEIGIAFTGTECPVQRPAESYPGKLTQLLYARYHYFKKKGQEKEKGLLVLPCELVYQNGHRLQQCVLMYARHWDLGKDFIHWILHHNVFCNTLVDRIVTGFPNTDTDIWYQRLGYRDTLLSVAEPYGLWIIESGPELVEKFSPARAGQPILLTQNLAPYQKRKMAILNGAHTALALAGLLAGKEQVGECMEDPLFEQFLTKLIREEIAPTLQLPQAELRQFSSTTLKRFQNPLLSHALGDIAHYSVAKWRERLLPSLLNYCESTGEIPRRMAFSLATLLEFYRVPTVNTQRREPVEILEIFTQCSAFSRPKYVASLLSQSTLWGIDLTMFPQLVEAVEKYLCTIQEEGIPTALGAL